MVKLLILFKKNIWRYTVTTLNFLFVYSTLHIERASQAALSLNQRGLGTELKFGMVAFVPQKFL